MCAFDPERRGNARGPLQGGKWGRFFMTKTRGDLALEGRCPDMTVGAWPLN